MNTDQAGEMGRKAALAWMDSSHRQPLNPFGPDQPDLQVAWERSFIDAIEDFSAGGPRWLAWNTVLAHRSCNGATKAMRLAAKFEYREAVALSRGGAAMIAWQRRYCGGTRRERLQAGRAKREPLKVPLAAFLPVRGKEIE